MSQVPHSVPSSSFGSAFQVVHDLDPICAIAAYEQLRVLLVPEELGGRQIPLLLYILNDIHQKHVSLSNWAETPNRAFDRPLMPNKVPSRKHAAIPTLLLLFKYLPQHH